MSDGLDHIYTQKSVSISCEIEKHLNKVIIMFGS